MYPVEKMADEFIHLNSFESFNYFCVQEIKKLFMKIQIRRNIPHLFWSIYFEKLSIFLFVSNWEMIFICIDYKQFDMSVYSLSLDVTSRKSMHDTVHTVKTDLYLSYQ